MMKKEGGISIKKNKVYFGGISIDRFVENNSTPVYLFSEKRLIDNYHALLSSFRKYYEDTEIFYSVKTNFELQILKTLRKEGSKAEAASALEVELALKSGFKGKDIVIDGPAWSDEEITYCLDNNIHTFNVDSIDLLDRLHNIASKRKQKFNISFRIYPKIKMSSLTGFVENYISKFGIPLSDAIQSYKYAKSLTYANPNSISAHIGSMLTSTKFHIKEIEILTKLASDLKQKLDIEIKDINIGGGFGVQSLNYYSIKSAILEKAGVRKYHKAPPIETFGKEIAEAFSNHTKNLNLSGINLILEAGRFIVSDSGILLTRVVSVKNDKWIFIDGGINLIPESIFFIRRGFIVANKIGKSSFKNYSIAGPTLNTVDVLADRQKLPKMEVGDVVIILDAGAYSLTRSNQFTLLRPSAHYITKEKKVKLLRKAEESSDLTSKMLL